MKNIIVIDPSETILKIIEFCISQANSSLKCRVLYQPTLDLKAIAFEQQPVLIVDSSFYPQILEADLPLRSILFLQSEIDQNPMDQAIHILKKPFDSGDFLENLERVFEMQGLSLKKEPKVFDEERPSSPVLQKEEKEWLKNELPTLVEKYVEAYCEKHFRELCKTILKKEIQNLAEAKAKLLKET